MNEIFARKFDATLSEYTKDEIKRRLGNLDLLPEKCKKCGKQVFWVKTRKSNYIAVNDELYNHSSECNFVLIDLIQLSGKSK